jgi:hypothetical protein
MPPAEPAAAAMPTPETRPSPSIYCAVYIVVPSGRGTVGACYLNGDPSRGAVHRACPCRSGRSGQRGVEGHASVGVDTGAHAASSPDGVGAGATDAGAHRGCAGRRASGGIAGKSDGAANHHGSPAAQGASEAHRARQAASAAGCCRKRIAAAGDALNLFNSKTNQITYAYGSLIKTDSLYNLCFPVQIAPTAVCQNGVMDSVLHPVEPLAVRLTITGVF